MKRYKKKYFLLLIFIFAFSIVNITGTFILGKIESLSDAKNNLITKGKVDTEACKADPENCRRQCTSKNAKFVQFKKDNKVACGLVATGGAGTPIVTAGTTLAATTLIAGTLIAATLVETDEDSDRSKAGDTGGIYRFTAKAASEAHTAKAAAKTAKAAAKIAAKAGNSVNAYVFAVLAEYAAKAARADAIIAHTAEITANTSVARIALSEAETAAATLEKVAKLFPTDTILKAAKDARDASVSALAAAVRAKKAAGSEDTQASASEAQAKDALNYAILAYTVSADASAYAAKVGAVEAGIFAEEYAVKTANTSYVSGFALLAEDAARRAAAAATHAAKAAVDCAAKATGRARNFAILARDYAILALRSADNHQ